MKLDKYLHEVIYIEDKWTLSKVGVHNLSWGLQADSRVEITLEQEGKNNN